MIDATTKLLDERYATIDIDAISDEELLLTMMRWTKCNTQSLDDDLYDIITQMIATQHIDVLDALVGVHLRKEICDVTALELLKLNYVAATVILDDLDSLPEVGEPTLENLRVLVAEFNEAYALYPVT